MASVVLVPQLPAERCIAYPAIDLHGGDASRRDDFRDFARDTDSSEPLRDMMQHLCHSDERMRFVLLTWTRTTCLWRLVLNEV